jgi:hypothetical protein
MREIFHDSFARFSQVRTTIKIKNANCHFCGQTNKKGNLYLYGIQRDDRPSVINWDDKSFCSIDCRRSYYT